jgi:hypothetical protein
VSGSRQSPHGKHVDGKRGLAVSHLYCSQQTCTVGHEWLSAKNFETQYKNPSIGHRGPISRPPWPSTGLSPPRPHVAPPTGSKGRRGGVGGEEVDAPDQRLRVPCRGKRRPPRHQMGGQGRRTTGSEVDVAAPLDVRLRSPRHRIRGRGRRHTGSRPPRHRI